MDAELKIKIGAETVEVTKSLTRLQQQLKTFKDALATATDAKRVDLLNRSIEKTSAIIAGVKSFKLGDPFAGLNKGANNATFALTNLSRVAQDAPFGFIGIANNLDPLLNSFQQLKNQTGSVGGAFKALGAGLLGPAGIAVGFSTISSLVVVAIQKYGSLSGALNALFGDTSSVAKANRELAVSFTEAQSKVAGEISTINALIAVARDKALSDAARGEAIKKLNDQYGSYLPNLNLENIGTQQVTDSVLKLNEALLRQAKIKGVQELISKEYEKQAQSLLEVQQIIEGNNTAAGKFLSFLQGAAVGGNAQSGFQARIANIGFASEDSAKKVKLFEDLLKKLLSEDATAGTLFKDTPLKVKELKVKPEKIKVEATKDNVDLGDLIKQVGSGAFIKSKFDTPEIVPLKVQNNDAFKKYLEDLEKARKESLKTAQVITDALTPAIDSFFSTLLSGSGNPFKAFGEALKQMIIQLTATIAKALLLRVIMSAINPAGTVGAAAGSTFGSFLKGALSGGIGGIANGGINVGSITGAANVGGQRLVAEVSGTSLKFLLDKTNGSVKRGF